MFKDNRMSSTSDVKMSQVGENSLPQNFANLLPNDDDLENGISEVTIGLNLFITNSRNVM